MKEVNYDYTKSNVNLVSTQNSYADKINKIKYNIEINKLYAGNLKPKNKMNIIAEKPETKILSSSLNFKPLGFIFIAIIILSALSFFLLFFLKRTEQKKLYSFTEVINKTGDYESQIINFTDNQMNKIIDYNVTEMKIEPLRFLDGNEYNITDGILYTKMKGIIKIDLYFDSPLTNLDHLFEGCKDIIYIDLSHIQSPSINNMSQTFKGCENLQKINLTSIDTSKVKSMDSLFENCTNLLEINGIEDFDTSSLTSISRMFYNCTELIFANLPAFNIDEIPNLNETFGNNFNLKYIDLTNSNNVSSIIKILPKNERNIIVFINQYMYNNHIKDLNLLNKNIEFLLTIDLKCDNGSDYKCKSCSNSSLLECEECNDGYNRSSDNFLSNMRCWKIEEDKEEEEEEYEKINYEEEKEKGKNNTYIDNDEEEKENEKNNTNIDNDEDEEGKEKEKVTDEEEEEDKKLINDKENENENEKDEEDEKIKENEEEEKDEEINEIYKEDKKEKI